MFNGVWLESNNSSQIQIHDILTVSSQSEFLLPNLGKTWMWVRGTSRLVALSKKCCKRCMLCTNMMKRNEKMWTSCSFIHASAPNCSRMRVVLRGNLIRTLCNILQRSARFSEYLELISSRRILGRSRGKFPGNTINRALSNVCPFVQKKWNRHAPNRSVCRWSKKLQCARRGAQKAMMQLRSGSWSSNTEGGCGGMFKLALVLFMHWKSSEFATSDPEMKIEPLKINLKKYISVVQPEYIEFPSSP